VSRSLLRQVALENSVSDGAGNVYFTINGQKYNSGYYTGLQDRLHIINGAHVNTFSNDVLTVNTGLSIASGGNACIGKVNQKFRPVEPGMRACNTFSNMCYTAGATNISDLLPSICKS
jgi:hypothetical protein